MSPIKGDKTLASVVIGTKARPVVWLFREDHGTETLSDNDRCMGDWQDPWKEAREAQHYKKAHPPKARNSLFPSAPWVLPAREEEPDPDLSSMPVPCLR